MSFGFLRGKRWWLLALGLCVLAGGSLRAAETNLLSEFAVRRWAVEEGLPEAVITSMNHLSDGFLWCTTPHHLVRFDGVRFVEDNPLLESMRGLVGVYRDARHILWCYGTSGAWRYGAKGWAPVKVPGTAKLVVLQLQNGTDGTLWAATNEGMCRFDGKAFVRVALPQEKEESMTVVDADVDEKGAFWLATARSIFQFHNGEYEPTELPADMSLGEITQVALGHSETLWVTAGGHLWSRKGGVWESVPLPSIGLNLSSQITDLREDEDGALWIGSVHGVFRWQHREWTGLTAREGVLFPLDVHSLAGDAEGNLWVGTSGGLVRLRRTPLHVYRTGLAWGGESITALYAESLTNFWTAVAGGGLLNGRPGAFQLVRLGSMPENTTVSTLMRSHDGTLWVGTQGDSLWRCDPSGKVAMVEPAAGTTLSTRGISALLEDRQHRIWVGTWEGLMRVDEEGKLASVSIPEERGVMSTPADTVHVLYEDHVGRVWAGYQSLGLICFLPSGRTQRFQQRDGLAGDSIRSLYQDSTNMLWIGTTRGLTMWDGKTPHTFSSTNGLVDNVVLQILEDQIGAMWLGTRHGIMRVRRDELLKVAGHRKVTLATRVFDLEAGMGDEECTGGLGALAVKTADGKMWFPTMEGIVMVDPQRIPNQPIEPHAYIEEVRTNGMPLYNLALSATPTAEQPTRLRLPPGTRDLEFQYTAPMFSTPERAYFRYFLEGYDRDWSLAGNERMTHYQRLPAGKYNFRVKSRDRDGAWSDPTPPVVVEVLPFFWQTVWFWCLAGVGLVMLVGWGVRTYDRHKSARLMRALEAQHAIERERARIARDIHDDVGAGLTEVAMLSELAQDDAPHPEQLHEHLDGIFQRARQMTQSLDEIVWAINPANDTLDSFVSYVGEFTQDFLSAAGVACRLDLPRDPPSVAIGANLRHHLCLAVKETLHNVVKHAGASEVHIEIKLVKQELTVKIEDDGRGFQAPGLGVSTSGQDGLKNLRARLREIDGDLQHESRAGRGTRLVLSVKLPTITILRSKTK